MDGDHDRYETPLSGRYASQEMQRLFSARTRIETWRALWVALAETEHELGLPVSRAQVEELRAHVADIDWQAAREREARVRHDVMAHVHAYGLAAPAAAPVIHLGATSCYVTDNADLVIMRRGLDLLARKTAAVVDRLAAFAAARRALPTLAFTHLQPAQPTTVGKRAALWAQDFALDLAEISDRAARLPFRGATGTTGTQASFLELFNGDHGKCEELNRRVAEKMGFAGRLLSVTGQTYTRKLDSQILAALAGLAESASKFAADLRLLAAFKEIEEPFEAAQIGSSAMPYKRNPMRAERVCSLARYLMSLPANAYATHGAQWMERTLDDSANRRLVLPQAFLAADAILELCGNVAGGLVVYPKMIERRLRAELPFMAAENIMMAAVKAGGDRQELHERIRAHAQAAARRVKEEGEGNDLAERLAADPAFAAVKDGLGGLLDPSRYVGRAPEQVDAFVREVAEPIRALYRDRPADFAGISV